MKTWYQVLNKMKVNGVRASILDMLYDGARDVVREFREYQLRDIPGETGSGLRCFICDPVKPEDVHEKGCPIPKLIAAVYLLDKED